MSALQRKADSPHLHEAHPIYAARLVVTCLTHLTPFSPSSPSPAALSTPNADGFKVCALLFGSPEAGAPLQPPPVAVLSPAGRAGFPADADEPGGAVAAQILAEVAATLEPSAARTLAPPPPSTSSPGGAPGAPYPHTRWGFRDGLGEGLGPEDFSALQRCVKEEAPNPSLKHLLALLRLANHDSEVFYKFRQVSD